MSVLRKLLREPLVHFAVIGAALFTLDGVTGPGEASRHSRSRSPSQPGNSPIVVDGDVRDRLIERWRQTHAGPPNPEELDALVERWIDAEVLYREGLARGLDRGDPNIRDRVAAKMTYVLESRISVPEPSEAELRAWHEAHAERWAEAEKIDFVQVFVQGDDPAAQKEARRLLALLESGASPDGLGDTFSGGRRYRGRQIADLARSFGDEFTAGLEEQPPGTWELRRSRSGLHLVRVEARTAGRVPGFESVRQRVREDWRKTRRSREVKAAVDALRADREIVVKE